MSPAEPLQLRVMSPVEQVDDRLRDAPTPDAIIMGMVFYRYVAAEMQARGAWPRAFCRIRLRASGSLVSRF